MLSRSTRAGTWENFDRLHHIFDPVVQCRRAAKRAWFQVRRAAAARDEATTARVSALREECELVQVLCNFLMEHHLDMGKSGSGSGDGKDEDE